MLEGFSNVQKKKVGDVATKCMAAVPLSVHENVPRYDEVRKKQHTINYL